MKSSSPSSLFSSPVARVGYLLTLVCLFVVSLSLVALAWFRWGDTFGTALWGISHHHAVEFEGHRVQVPNGWRAVSTPAGLQQLTLETPLEHAVSSSIILRRQPPNSNAEKAVNAAREGLSRLFGPVPERNVPWHNDAALTGTYKCLLTPEPNTAHTVIAFCSADQPAIRVNFSGEESRLPDLAIVLRSMLPTGTPAQ